MDFRSGSRKRAGWSCAPRAFGIRLSVILVLLSLAVIPGVPAHAEQWKNLNPQGYVNDFAGVLNAATVKKLTEVSTEVDQKATLTSGQRSTFTPVLSRKKRGKLLRK